MAGETCRELIAAKIKADNPLFIVKDFPVGAPENLGAGKVFVSVYRESVANAPQLAALTETLKIVVITPTSGTAIAEEKLELALDEVLTSVQSLNFAQWSTAERAPFMDKFIGYEVSLTANTENPYKPS